MKKSILTLIIIGQLIATHALALNAVGTRVGSVTTVVSTGATYFTIVGGVISGTSPACSATAFPNTFIIPNEATNSGQQVLSLVLASKASGLPLTINGAGTCTRISNIENLLNVTMTQGG